MKVWTLIIISLIIIILVIYSYLKPTKVHETILESSEGAGGSLSTSSSKFSKEEECRKIFEDIFKTKFPKVRPDFLKNPATKRNLELDGFSERFMVAFEYNGKQHYTSDAAFHKNVKDFEYQVAKDNFKKHVCKKRKITLVEIPYTVKREDLREYIIKSLKKYKKKQTN